MSIYHKFIPVLLLFFAACQSDPILVDLGNVPAEEVHVLRYDQDIFTVNRQNAKEQLDVLAKKYPLFISGDYKDPARIFELMDYLEDPLQKDLKEKCKQTFTDLSALEKTLSEGFRYYKYYYPQAPSAKVYGYVSGLSFEHPIEWEDSTSSAAVALDLYLGPGFPLYYQMGFEMPQYLSYKLQEKFIPVDLFTKVALVKYDLEKDGNTLIEKIVSHGKMQYFIKAMLPFVPDSTRLMYHPEQMKWCQESEERLWQYFVRENLLHSTDFMVYKKYLEDGPFTSSLEKESPGRIADYIGLRIVQSYMENSEVTLDALMKEKDLLNIFQKSKFKPE
ncbi:MAG: hypothetical protein NT150_12815 [Bacteroidetes bacterium]|nr:hypothetical protein [Bacteroidota bacterium]